MGTKIVMLTTLDNPFDPFVQYDEWFAYDTQQGYNTCAYLARITKTSPELSDEDVAIAIEDAIDEIMLFNVLGVYKKVVHTEEDNKEQDKEQKTEIVVQSEENNVEQDVDQEEKE